MISKRVSRDDERARPDTQDERGREDALRAADAGRADPDARQPGREGGVPHAAPNRVERPDDRA